MTGDLTEFLIRPARHGDGPALEAVCVATGLAGEDARPVLLHPERLAWLYLHPYLQLEPEGALVLEDDLGVCGYVLTVRDTPRFEAQRSGVLLPVPDAAGLPEADAALTRQLRTPAQTPPGLTGTWPAHLHLNLLRRVQGRGAGSRLLRLALTHLAGVGVHLGTDPRNTRARTFYARHGFTPWQEAPGVVWMTRDASPRGPR